MPLGFLIHQPPDGNAPGLVFLHGWREGFIDDSASPTPITGLRNLRKHGVPKLLDDPRGPLVVRRRGFSLERLPADASHPVLRCAVVAPQLPDDTQRWSVEHAAEIRRVLDALLPGRPLYVVGFSMGGRGAVTLGPELGARALLLIDPSSMGDASFAQSLEDCALPTWSVYGRHEDERLQRNITRIQDGLTSFAVHPPGLDALPAPGGKWRSAITPRARGNLHEAVCADATLSHVPYEWLLAH